MAGLITAEKTTVDPAKFYNEYGAEACARAVMFSYLLGVKLYLESKEKTTAAGGITLDSPGTKVVEGAIVSSGIAASGCDTGLNSDGPRSSSSESESSESSDDGSSAFEALTGGSLRYLPALTPGL